MCIVPAGMHDVRRLRAIGHVVFFLDRQRVHIGTDADHRAAFAQVADYARLADAGLRLDAKLGEGIGHQAGGALFLKAEFWMHVDVTPPGNDLVGQLLGLGVKGSGSGHG